MYCITITTTATNKNQLRQSKDSRGGGRGLVAKANSGLALLLQEGQCAGGFLGRVGDDGLDAEVGAAGGGWSVVGGRVVDGWVVGCGLEVVGVWLVVGGG